MQQFQEVSAWFFFKNIVMSQHSIYTYTAIWKIFCKINIHEKLLSAAFYIISENISLWVQVLENLSNLLRLSSCAMHCRDWDFVHTCWGRSSRGHRLASDAIPSVGSSATEALSFDSVSPSISSSLVYIYVCVCIAILPWLVVRFSLLKFHCFHGYLRHTPFPSKLQYYYYDGCCNYYLPNLNYAKFFYFFLLE